MDHAGFESVKGFQMTIDLKLDKETEALVEDQLTTGQFATASDVVRAGLVTLKMQDQDAVLARAAVIEKLAKCDDGRPDVSSDQMFGKIADLLSTLKQGRAA